MGSVHRAGRERGKITADSKCGCLGNEGAIGRGSDARAAAVSSAHSTSLPPPRKAVGQRTQPSPVCTVTKPRQGRAV